MILTKDLMKVILESDLEQLNEQDIEQLYDGMLDDCYGEIDICGYKYSPSRALSEVDSVAYSCGFADYTSSLLDDEFVEVLDDQGNVFYYKQEEVDDLLQELGLK